MEYVTKMTDYKGSPKESALAKLIEGTTGLDALFIGTTKEDLVPKPEVQEESVLGEDIDKLNEIDGMLDEGIENNTEEGKC